MAILDRSNSARFLGDLMRLADKMSKENEALWDMVDDFNTAVQKAAARLP